MNRFELNDDVVLLTGATGHLGQAIAHVLAHAGAHVVLCGRDEEKLIQLERSLQKVGGHVTRLVFDVRDEQGRRDAIGVIEKRLGRLDGIVNNAYAGKTGSIKSSTVADFENATAFNLSAPFDLVQRALPLLQESGSRRAGGASVVNVASMYGMVSPNPDIYLDSGANNPPFYGATKAGLIQLTRYLACHLAESNIRVNSISPGPFPSQGIKQTQPEFHERLRAKVPMKRIGIASEVADPVLFLLSAGASYITGVNLPVDGGWTAW
ncbi:SDR family NAD(P)-dependent oxidoreductase [Herbaspirillum sp. meg3]|uniref:SDR family NAD(P)-dependent oxidoreductase n=1 Tax=Herbaspirillum sp. meg3 TaxID=2025949 RepID=UPI0012FD98EF|nr:SDR family oxidoreductase [Herbaspirillum sp. meg3]